MLKKMLILGGDIRQLKCAEEFAKEGYSVSVFGFPKKYLEYPYFVYNDLKNAISENEILIMGLPVSKDSIMLNAPLYDIDIPLKDIYKYINNSQIIIGGMLNEEQTERFAAAGCTISDYYLREELIIKNVIPTVEGAIALAMEETPYTIHSSRCLVTGFGRIGKLLAKSLAGLGAHVTVSARKLSDFAWIDCYNYNYLKTNDIKNFIHEYDIIFNTIPCNVLDKACLKHMRKDSLIIDLASIPGGVDFKQAKEMGIKTIWALSLPGKVAPHTAGMIIKNTISNILLELGV